VQSETWYIDKGGDIMKVTINLPYFEYVGRAAKKVYQAPGKAVGSSMDKMIERAMYNVAKNIVAEQEKAK